MKIIPVILIPSCSVVVIAFMLYTPLPDNIEEPWKVQCLLGVLKANQYLSKLAVLLGYDEIKVLRTTLPLIFRAAAQEPNGTVKVKERLFNDVKVKVYEPAERKKKLLPGLIYFHGGGFITFSVDTYDKVLRHLCLEAQIVIMAPEYRLSPEYTFPVPLSDCIEATKFFYKHTKKYGVDRDNIGIAGDSAGGNLAAAASFNFVYLTHIPVKYQILLYPELQAFDFKTSSMVTKDNVMPSLLTTEAVTLAFASYWRGRDGFQYIPQFLNNNHTSEELKTSKYATYVNKTLIPEKLLPNTSLPEVQTKGNEELSNYFKSTLINPMFSPLLADDLSQMPPTFIVVGEYDVLRDDGFMYRKRLIDAGVDVRLLHRSDGFHAMFSFTRLQIGIDVLKEIVAFIVSDH